MKRDGGVENAVQKIPPGHKQESSTGLAGSVFGLEQSKLRGLRIRIRRWGWLDEAG